MVNGRWELYAPPPPFRKGNKRTWLLADGVRLAAEPAVPARGRCHTAQSNNITDRGQPKPLSPIII